MNTNFVCLTEGFHFRVQITFTYDQRLGLETVCMTKIKVGLTQSVFHAKTGASIFILGFRGYFECVYLLE